MTKAELIRMISQQHELTMAQAKTYVDRFFDAMTDALVRGERVELRGLFMISIKEYKSYTGRNPMTGEAVGIKSKKLPYFKPSPKLKTRVNR